MFFVNTTLKKKVQVAVDFLSSSSGRPSSVLCRITRKNGNRKIFTLAYLREEKTNLVPTHPRGCTAESIPRGPGSPFSLKAFLSLFQDPLPKISFSESGSSDGKSTLVFPYQLKGN